MPAPKRRDVSPGSCGWVRSVPVHPAASTPPADTAPPEPPAVIARTFIPDETASTWRWDGVRVPVVLMAIRIGKSDHEVADLCDLSVKDVALIRKYDGQRARGRR